MADFDVVKLARFAERLQADPTPASTAEDVIGYLRMELGADHASITIIRPDQELQTIAPSSPIAEELDRIQYDLGEGPCYASSWREQTLLSANLADDTRWPVWGPTASPLGVSSILATALSTREGSGIGSLNSYWNHPRQLTPSDVAFVGIVARHAVLALSAAWNEDQLNVALDSRKLIGQAEGILMERYDLDEDRAAEALHRYAQDHNTELRDLAIHLIHSGQLPPVQQQRRVKVCLLIEVPRSHASSSKTTRRWRRGPSRLDLSARREITSRIRSRSRSRPAGQATATYEWPASDSRTAVKPASVSAERTTTGSCGSGTR